MFAVSLSIHPAPCCHPHMRVCYILPLGWILTTHNISSPCYADDIQFYLPLKADGQVELHSLLDCLADVRKWMRTKFLNLNESKIDIVGFGKPSAALSTKALGSLGLQHPALGQEPRGNLWQFL